MTLLVGLERSTLSVLYVKNCWKRSGEVTIVYRHRRLELTEFFPVRIQRSNEFELASFFIISGTKSSGVKLILPSFVCRPCCRQVFVLFENDEFSFIFISQLFGIIRRKSGVTGRRNYRGDEFVDSSKSRTSAVKILERGVNTDADLHYDAMASVRDLRPTSQHNRAV